MDYGSTRSLVGGIIRYDAQRRRLWVGHQRLHHGLTGVVLAAAGVALMAHDWRDRGYWFQGGPQSQG